MRKEIKEKIEISHKDTDYEDIFSFLIGAVKDGAILFLENVLPSFWNFVIITLTFIVNFFIIKFFKIKLEKHWSGAIKWGIIALVFSASTIIPLGIRYLSLNNSILGMSENLEDYRVTETYQAFQINTYTVNENILKATIDTLTKMVSDIEITPSPFTLMNPLDASCLTPVVWGAYRDEMMIRKDNCWEIPGIILNDRKLDFFIDESAKYGTYGIYTPIMNATGIKVRLLINDFSIPLGASYSRLFFGIVPTNNPIPEKGIIFALQMDNNKQQNPVLRYRSPNTIQTTSLNDFISIGNSHIFLLELQGNAVTLSVDGVKNPKKFSLPDDPSYFWIGYTVEDGVVLDSTIEEISFLK